MAARDLPASRLRATTVGRLRRKPQRVVIVSGLTLNELIQAIAGAVAEAQDKVQRFQISTVRRYFDEFNRPISVDVRLPSMSQDAEPGEERLVHVPLLSLVGPQLLKIKDVDVEFEVGLGSLTQAPPGTADPSSEVGTDATEPPPPDETGSDDAAAGSSHKILGIDIGAPRNRGAGSTARVTIKVENQEPSDGMVRLIQHLDKLI
jgi:hypothetical protein